MSEASNSEATKKKTQKPKTNEEILMGFQKLRNEQRTLATKINELELDLHEHKLAVETLKDLEDERKCFKLVGGILCERTVKDVLPEVKANEQQINKVIESLNQQLVIKGTEINKYKDEYNIVLRNGDEVNQPSDDSKSSNASNASNTTILAS